MPRVEISELFSECRPAVLVDSIGGQYSPFLCCLKNFCSSFQWGGWCTEVISNQQYPSPRQLAPPTSSSPVMHSLTSSPANPRLPRFASMGRTHGSLAGGYFWCDSFIRPTPLVLMGVEQLLATYSKSVKQFSVGGHNLECVLDHLSRVPIAGITFVGMAGIAGMFVGQSTSASTSVSLS